MGRYLRITLAVVVVAGAALLLPRIASTRGEVREVTLVARDMTYYIEGQEEPNPSLRFRAGEQVRLTFRNEDDGMEHDFAIPGWNVGTKLIDGKGQDVVSFRVPAKGTGSYACTPHTEMMNGQVIVE